MPGTRAIIRYPDGTEQDITDLVRILYDGVVGSLDWGSGWWSGEDAAAVAWIGFSFGWVNHQEAAEFAVHLAQFRQFREQMDADIPVWLYPPATGGPPPPTPPPRQPG